MKIPLQSDPNGTERGFYVAVIFGENTRKYSPKGE